MSFSRRRSNSGVERLLPTWPSGRSWPMCVMLAGRWWAHSGPSSGVEVVPTCAGLQPQAVDANSGNGGNDEGDAARGGMSPLRLLYPLAAAWLRVKSAQSGQTQNNWSWRRCILRGRHQMSLNIAAGLGLGLLQQPPVTPDDGDIDVGGPSAALGRKAHPETAHVVVVQLLQLRDDFLPGW